ncbi:MAG: hypothetical protein ACLPTZ_01910 [Beijerinckiaceae bacterium]
MAYLAVRVVRSGGGKLTFAVDAGLFVGYVTVQSAFNEYPLSVDPRWDIGMPDDARRLRVNQAKRFVDA